MSKRLTRKQKRIGVILGLGLVLILAMTLILNALRDQIVFFYSPTELLGRPELSGTAVRIGGLVEEGSWVRQGNSNVFSLSDGTTVISVSYDNLLPDLFREGQGVIAEGHLAGDGTFAATSVLAKHDENYVPKEVVAALKEQGNWHGAADASASGAAN